MNAVAPRVLAGWIAVGGGAGCTEPNPYLLSATAEATATGETAASNSSGAAATDEDGTPSSSGEGTAPGCEQTASRCVQAAPDGWMGPFAWAEVPNRGGALQCAPPFDVPLVEAWSDITAPSAECGCDCGPLFGGQCGGATLTYHAVSGCGGTGDDPLALVPDCNETGVLSTVGSFEYLAPVVVRGSCQPMPSVELKPAGFLTRHLGCGADLDPLDCGQGRTCAPVPTDPFESQLCVARLGEHPCPADGDYVESRLLFGSLDDGRGCEPCTCALPAGPCSGHSAQLATGDACDGSSAGSLVRNGCAEGIGADPVMSVLFDPGEPPSNACTAALAVPTGAVAGADPVTFCCAR